MPKSIYKYLIIGFLAAQSFVMQAQDSTVTVLHLQVLDNIDPRTNRYTELGLEKAIEIGADLIILELDTYGGALTDADEIRTRILNLDIPIYAFINKDAASAGALISIACDSIYMTKGASIGAATVVTGEGDQAPDKYQSYMRSIMRSTAEATGRNPQIAEAMVDEDIDLDSIAMQGKVLTFSTSEAIKFGFCEAQLDDIEQILERSGIDNYELVKYELDQSEKIISLFLNPFVSGILILVIIGGIYFELQTPGIGFPIIASIIAAILYFTPFYLNGLAENWEIILFICGVVLIAVEVFIIPGFGVAGILGLVFTLGALTLVMINNDGFDFQFTDPDRLFQAIATTLAGLMGSIIIMFFGGARLANSSVVKRITLSDTQMGFTSTNYSVSLIGQEGIAQTVLRPAGKIAIGDEIYDANTRGEYIPKDTKIKVISNEGTSLKVKQID
ncbi:MAG: membrane-bound serine protease (ClpP class) [Cyclobacteriaceae bacterium]|jgi:membrane-bound serine protease (ClpP class)